MMVNPVHIMRWYFVAFVSLQLHSVSSGFLSKSAPQTGSNAIAKDSVDLPYMERMKRFFVSRHPIITPPKVEDYQCTAEDWQFYRHHVECSPDQALNIFDKTEYQDNNRWKSERQIRIVSSNAYGLYTYANEIKNRSALDWERKIGNYVLKEVPPNKNTEYGRNNEVFGLEIFHDMIVNMGGKTYTRSGLMINTNAPWISFCPDAFIEVNKQFMLIEVKCPVIGQVNEGAEFLERIDFIQYVAGTYELRKRTIHYAQIQLELLLTNLTMAKLVLYCKKDDSIHVIDVNFDPVYAESLYTKLKMIYFKHFLPFINLHREKLYKIQWGM